MTPQETAKAILKLYDGKPERWTTGTYARSASGNRVDPGSPHATCWCLYGAADRVSADLRDSDAFEVHAANRVHSIAIGRWNDREGRTFADVVSLLERIAAGEGGAE